MTRFPLLLLSIVALLAAPAPALAQASSALFPKPAELEADVDFWLRIYSEVGTDGGLVHDSRHLEVVYEVIKFPDGASSRTRERLVEKTKRRYREQLRRLARGKRTGLNPDQARILELWGGDDVSNRTLHSATSRLRFQLGQRDKFRSGLIRSGAWRDYIRKTFTDMGLPVELAALPHVESSFTPHAYSRVGASGLWQFTRSTGKRYMRIDHVVDERLDPLIASVAAARLLEHNHRATGTWPLALTAYNHGASGMRRAARKMGTKDIAVINRKYKSRTFGFASRNFYPEFLAALEIDQNPEKYFGKLPVDSPPRLESIELPFYASASALVRALGVDRTSLRRANPALRDTVWNDAKHVPKNFTLRVPSDLLSAPLATLVASVPKSARLASQTRDSYHKVARGETLSAIASRYRTSVRELQSLNGLRSQNRIRAGQRLRLPEDDGSRASRSRARASVREDPPTNGLYSVRRGDSLARIAGRFGTSEHDLLEWNTIRNRHQISVGQRLRVVPPLASTGDAGTRLADASPAETQPGPVRQAPIAEARPTLPTPPTEEPRTEALPTRVPQPRGPRAEAPPDDQPGAGGHPEVLSEFTPPPSSPADFSDRPSPPTLSEATVSPSVADAAARELGQDGDDPLLADPGDYSVAADGTIEVQAAETLGHYAEWLDVRASRLRSLNNMRYGTPLAIGARLRVDFPRVTPEVFEARRAEHHRALQGEFFERYAIDGTKTHVVRRGDSIWQLAERSYNVPIWLVRQYNPDVDFADLHAGEEITIPHLHPR
jgi:membrane-bound lytic murein transglycosylase D